VGAGRAKLAISATGYVAAGIIGMPLSVWAGIKLGRLANPVQK
jgi:hypothetical protein